MRKVKSLAGQLIVPVLAFVYAIHAIWELNDGTYQRVTIIYTMVIVIPMFILGALAVGGDVRRWLRGKTSAEQVSATDRGQETLPGSTLRLVLFIGASIALVALLEYVGYLLGFFVYVCFVLWAVNFRRAAPLFLIAIAVTAMIHFVFAGLLGQDLPLGFMSSWLGE